MRVRALGKRDLEQRAAQVGLPCGLRSDLCTRHQEGIVHTRIKLAEQGATVNGFGYLDAWGPSTLRRLSPNLAKG